MKTGGEKHLQEQDDSLQVSEELDSTLESQEEERTQPQNFKLDILQAEKLRCILQMVYSNLRTRHTNDDTGESVNVVDTMSFCNHHNLPDDVIQELAREAWKLINILHDTSASNWPNVVKFVDQQIPGVQEIFPSAVWGCKYCDIPALTQLSSLQERLSRADTEVKGPNI